MTIIQSTILGTLCYLQVLREMNRKERRTMGELAPTKKGFRNKAAQHKDKTREIIECQEEEEEITLLEKRIQTESPASGTQSRRWVLP